VKLNTVLAIEFKQRTIFAPRYRVTQDVLERITVYEITTIIEGTQVSPSEPHRYFENLRKKEATKTDNDHLKKQRKLHNAERVLRYLRDLIAGRMRISIFSLETFSPLLK
jgi:hypothetical protein